ncbi:hypothetical protein OV208_28700 [Corallococcus sp. bb12-1]|uniref:hypothetical protein n=1 Tax=Corallococcus sp. bb12-1 TaxID=2996784 RepID=UPI00226F4F5A|nr:hypothetical protein [Corallococcus sp. bb12-1]MCY1045330.1 hypothetical protein [Corallococcus sp. bb12-1]
MDPETSIAISIADTDNPEGAARVLYQVALVPEPAGHPDELRILQYLRSGSIVAVAPGICRDVLDPRRPFLDRPVLLTDGVHSWLGELAHYVARYHVRLPEEWVEHMRRHHWTAPAS